MDLPGDPTRPDDQPAHQPEQSVPGEVMDSGGPQGEQQSGRGKRIALIAGAAVAVVGIGGGAVAAASYLSGGGAQPEDVLPSGALAYAEMDLDPAANQKVAIYRLARKFPDLAKQGGSQDAAVKDTVVKSLVEDTGELSYDTDVKPWLGDRAGAAIYPGPDSDSEPQVAIAIEYTDEAKMEAALRKAGGDIGWVAKDGFVVITEQQVQARSLAAKAEDSPLSEQQSYVRDVDALEGDQIAVAWADVGELYGAVGDAAGALTGQDLTSLGARAEPKGRVVVGLHAGSDYLEVQGNTFDAGNGVWSGNTSPGSAAGTGLAGTLPADAAAALSMTGLGDGLVELWSTLGAELGDKKELQAVAKRYGVELPRDLEALFGDETAFGVNGALTGDTPPNVTVAARGADEQRAQSVTRLLSEQLTGSPGAVQAADGTVVYGNDPETVAAVAGGSGGLGDSETFRKAVPDAATAGLLVYVDIGKLTEAFADGADAANLEPLSAFGMTSTGKDDVAMRLRLTVK